MIRGPRVVHISTVHSSGDPRVRLKELRSIAEHDLDAHFVTGDPIPDGLRDGVAVHRIVRERPHRLRRVILLPARAVWRALMIPASVYHFHDPEILPWAWLLLFRRAPVVYDVHEDYSLAMDEKFYLPRWLRRVAKLGIVTLERFLSFPFEIVVAELCYRARFPSGTPILNFPRRELTEVDSLPDPQSRHLLYTGTVTVERGALNMVRLVREVPDLEITIVGWCVRSVADQIRAAAGDAMDRIHLVGEGRFVPFQEIVKAYAAGGWTAGVVLMSDSAHYRDKQLTKFFEYMAVGLPAIVSDLPAWRSLIADQGVGVCVDPERPESIAGAVDRLGCDPAEAREMGLRGKELVKTRYHWEAQAQRLLDLYRERSGPRAILQPAFHPPLRDTHYRGAAQEPAPQLAGLVSVITPTHNDSAFLRRVVQSVATQSVPVLEHIIIDDGSTDRTPAILRELASQHPHLLVITQKRAGAALARNAGIDAARGRYIAFLDADDVWHERKVERQIGFMEKHGHVFSYGDYVEFDCYRGHLRKRYNLPQTVGHAQLLRGCPIGCLTAAYNQEVLGKHHMPVVRSGHDWGLWLEITRLGVVAHKYPGLEASYSNGRSSLSSHKLRKVLHVYRIYRDGEKLTRGRAVVRALQHSAIALFKKARLIYS
ncbi:MAG: glycosyltransferase [Spirochaetota bacterium]